MLKKFYQKFQTRLAALVDKSAWFLIVPALVIVYCIDPVRTISVLTWMLFVAILVGFCIQISRIAWSPIDLVNMVGMAARDPRASAIVVAAVIVFVGLLVLSVVLWTRP
ncbi:hypothetical protein [Herbaspirillum frisingense]|uniref:hypothetical protein n=1 Tax=Herbaspirillum frisingense TaxID=92645 RepID=UPI0039B001A8